MVLDLKQGSEEWLHYRRNSITATDFAVIAAEYGLSKYPFKTRKAVDMLIKEKINGTTIPDNPYFERGREWEPKLIEAIIGNYNTLFNYPLSSPSYAEVIHLNGYPRIMASLDGQLKNIPGNHSKNIIIEAKTSGKNLQASYELEDYYKFQVAHQCHCAEVEEAVIAIAWFHDLPGVLGEFEALTTTNIVAADVIDKESWLKMCEEFLQKLDNSLIISTDELMIFQEYKKLDNEIKNLEERKEQIKLSLVEKYPVGITFKEFSIKRTSKKITGYGTYIKDNKITIPDEYINESISYTIKENQ